MGADDEPAVPASSEEHADSSETVHKAGDAMAADQTVGEVDFFSL